MKPAKRKPEREHEPVIVTDQDRAAMARLARGLSPCEVWLDEYGRELDSSGNLVRPDEPPGPHRFGREAEGFSP